MVCGRMHPPRRRPRALGVVLLALAVAFSGCITGAALAEAPLVRVDAGASASVPFEVPDEGPVHFSVESRNAIPFGVCLVREADLPVWQQGNRAVAKSCHDNVRQASETVVLPAGQWAMALSCGAPEPCVMAVRAFEA